MQYSFTRSQKKYILHPVTKVWIFYIILSGVILGLFGLRVNLQIQEMIIESKNMQQKQKIFEHQINVLNQNKSRVEFEIKEVKDSQIDNILMRDLLENLLNIIPEQITLSLVQIKDGALTIKGTTPTKELFIFLLQDPLKAIFGESKVNFIELSNGTYGFTSQSKANDLFVRKDAQ